MQVELIPGRALDSALAKVWTDLQLSNPELASPCFAPEFTQAVATARTEAEVAVIQENGAVVAFFPFQRRANGLGIPVGGIVSDFEGLICRPDFACDARELLRQCRLSAWDFDHLLVSQTVFAPFHKNREPSPRIDLSQGYEKYTAERRASGSEQIKKCENMMRRMELEIGPLRFVSHSPEPPWLQEVLDWKSQQYLRSGWRDIFALEWGHLLIERIQATQSENFAGMLSLLFAGERLVAGHFGMRSRSVWHYWFPAYNREFAKYSPGLILLLKMAEHAPALGLTSIDLGKEMSLYKRRLMNGSV